MDTPRDGDATVIALDGRPGDIARMSGFAAAELLARRRRRTTVPKTLDRSER